jgi:hypothetical protein
MNDSALRQRNQFSRMMKLNPTSDLLFIFALTSFASFITHNWTEAAAFATMAAGFALAGQSYGMGLSPASPANAPALPAWRRDSSLLLLVTAIVLFGFQIGEALHQAVANLSR